MLAFFTPWYGWDSTCIRCGRQWQDGEWSELPFANNIWTHDENGDYKPMTPRQHNIATAKRFFRAMPPASENYYGI
jgi:hypothetical protein